jgi:hypothetical protein
MPRDVSSEFQDGLDAHITQPVYLIALLTDTPFYWTTGAEVEWNSETWIPAAAKVLQLGDRGATIGLRNDDNSGSSLVLNNTLRDKECRIYLHYNGDAEELFRGYCSDSSVNLMLARVEVLPNRAQNALIPRRRVAAPTFTNLPRPGEIIRWDNEYFKVSF